MDYKKKYNEAQKWIESIYTELSHEQQMEAEAFFPELEESKDERIRKEIMDFIDTNTIDSDERRDKWFSYLEKHKPISFTSSEDRKVKMSLMQYISELNQDVVHLHPGIETCNEWIAWLEKQCEQKEINLVEILKHYPRETELYSPLYGKLWLAEIDEEREIITCYKHPLDEGCTRAILEQEDTVSFYSNGTTGLPDFSISKDCMLFLYDIKKQGEQKPADKVESIVVKDFDSVFCREQVEEIDKRIEEAQRLYNAKLMDAMQKVEDFPMTD